MRLRCSLLDAAKIVSYEPAMLTTPEGTLDYDLECLATGNLLPTIKWFKDGTEVTNIPNSEIDLASSSNATFIYNKLVFKSVQPADYGNWTCEASNLNSGDTLKTDSANTLLVVQCKLLIYFNAGCQKTLQIFRSLGV